MNCDLNSRKSNRISRQRLDCGAAPAFVSTSITDGSWPQYMRHREKNLPMNTTSETTSAPPPSKPLRGTFNLQPASSRHSPSTIHDSRCTSHHSATQWAGGALIYLVDDEQGLTELYALFLRGSGHRVRIFNCRADALAGLNADREKPDLLVTDCLGDTMPIHLFIERCRVAHPALKILMASGLSEDDVRSYCLRPDRFLRKPFTADRFVREVSATLTA